MTMLLADRLSSTSAPDTAARVEGGCGAHRSSQISTWKVKGKVPSLRNRRSVPKGTMRSQMAISPEVSLPLVNQRGS